jgi:WD40 repeat protein/uncharacterized caspase-like protein
VAQVTRQLTPVAAPPEPPFLRIDAEFHTQVVNRLAQDRDGQIIVTGSDDKTIRIWQAATGAKLATLRVPIGDGDEGAIYAVAISPDGKTLLAGGYTGVTWDRAFAIYIFDLETQRLRGRLPNLPAPINHLAFAPDGHSFAIALGNGGGIRLIDATNGATLASDAFQARSTWVDFDQSGRFAAASFDGDIRLYDANGRRLAHRAPVPGSHPYAVAFSPDGRSLAVGYADQPRVEIINAQDLAARASLVGVGERGGLGAVAWGRDGSLFAAGSVRNAAGATLVRHWGPGGTGRPTDWTGLRDTVFQVATTADGGVLLAGADPALIRLDRTGRTVFRKEGPGLDFRDMADQRFTVSADGLSVELQTKTMAAPWLVDMGQRSVHPLATARGIREITPPSTAPAGPKLRVENWRNTAGPQIDGQSVRLEPEELSRSYAVTPAQDLVVIGTDYQLRVYRRDGGLVDTAALPGPAWTVGVSGDGRTVVAAVGDGTLRWFGLDAQGHLDRRISVFLAADGQRWVAWTKDGQFDHSDTGGKELVGLLLNRGKGQPPEWFSFAQVYRLFYAPDAVASQLHGQPPAQPVAGIEDLRGQLAKSSPPTIELLSLCWPVAGKDECHPVAPSTTSRGIRANRTEPVDAVVPADVQVVRIRYRLIGDTAANSTVDLFVNGRNNGRGIHAAGASGANEAEQSVTVEVGVNQVQLRAYDPDELAYAQSRTIEIARAAGEGAAPKPKLFILAVGIDHYPPGINSLAFAVADARAVAQAIKQHAPANYSTVDMTELYDQAASAQNTLKALDAIGRKAGVDDTVLIYLSGHGITIDKRYYFVTQNVTSVEAIPGGAISETALVKALGAIQSRNALVFIDTCHAGAFSLDSASQIAHETGRYILAASASLEEALDSYDDRNGVFATAVLRGLAGGALSSSKTTISNFDLGLFVAPLVHQLAIERHHDQSARFKIAAEDAQPFSIVELKPKP